MIETCVQPERSGRADLVRLYEQALLNSRQVQTLPISPALAKQAIRLRLTYNIRIPDALQLSAALESGATLFVTNDRRLQRVSDLTVLVLDDYSS